MSNASNVWNKRRLIKTGAALAMAGAAISGASAQTTASNAGATMPQRGHFVIRNAYIMTMDPELGDIKVGDVQINNGEIVAVGANLPAPGAEPLDGRDMIAMPGFVDAHTHYWSTQMRGRFGDTPDTVYFRTSRALADGYTPEDVYQGTRLGSAEAIFSGITTSVDFFHNNRGMDFVNGSLRALKETGIRCRFLFGASTLTLPTQTVDLAGFEQFNGSWNRIVGDAPLTLGLAWRGPLGIVTPAAGVAIRPELSTAKEEFETARRLGLPIAIHVSGVTAKAQFDSLVKGNFLGKDVQFAHFSNASPEDIKIAVESQASLALTPLTELRVGYGITKIGHYLDGGMSLGVGIDSNSLAGASDMFTVMKVFQNIEAGRLNNELALPPRRLLELATIGGARSIGMDGQIGSIKVGKRADMIMIDTNALNMGMFADDPAHLIVEAAQPCNVDTVIVDGRVLKRGGKLTSLDSKKLVGEARLSIANIVSRVHA